MVSSGPVHFHGRVCTCCCTSMAPDSLSPIATKQMSSEGGTLGGITPPLCLSVCGTYYSCGWIRHLGLYHVHYRVHTHYC